MKEKQEAAEISGESVSTIDAQSGLRTLFISELNSLYAAENHLIKNIPVLKAAASDSTLQDEFERHLKQTGEHVNRLQQIFDILNEQPGQENCAAIEALTREAERIIVNTTEGSSTRDAALIMSAQKIEHYEIATYGSLVQLADTLQADEIVELLKVTLDEEKQTDKNLSELAKSRINHISVAEIN